ncbi:hypothetical protein BC940DRAFT_347283 [Gongronella butleri]|nr:hypothetical protein BC940DRAFT_347283 [Gongronella butleri]
MEDRACPQEEHSAVDHVYLKSSGRRQVLLVHWGYIIAFVCLPAALLQAFGDRGPIIQLCLYWLLGFVILYALFYAASYGIDALFIRRAQAIIKNLEQEPIYNNYIEDHYLWCVDSADNLPFTDSQARQKQINEQFAEKLWRWLDFAAFASFVIISLCTMAYVYNNVNKD